MQASDFQFVHESVDVVASLSEPFRAQLDLGYFYYGKYYDDGHALILNNMPSTLDFMLEQRTQLIVDIDESCIKPRFNHLIDMEGYYRDVVAEFNIWYPINLFKRYPGYYEIFALGHVGERSHAVLDKYINEMSKVDRLCETFLQRAAPLIAIAEQKKFVVAEAMRSNLRGLEVNKKHKNRFYLDKVAYLTQREQQCLYHLNLGATSKIAGQQLDVSHRTVETHVENLRVRFGCNSKHELLQKLREVYQYSFDGYHTSRDS